MRCGLGNGLTRGQGLPHPTVLFNRRSAMLQHAHPALLRVPNSSRCCIAPLDLLTLRVLNSGTPETKGAEAAIRLVAVTVSGAYEPRVEVPRTAANHAP